MSTLSNVFCKAVFFGASVYFTYNHLERFGLNNAIQALFENGKLRSNGEKEDSPASKACERRFNMFFARLAVFNRDYTMDSVCFGFSAAFLALAGLRFDGSKEAMFVGLTSLALTYIFDTKCKEDFGTGVLNTASATAYLARG